MGLFSSRNSKNFCSIRQNLIFFEEHRTHTIKIRYALEPKQITPVQCLKSKHRYKKGKCGGSKAYTRREFNFHELLHDLSKSTPQIFIRPTGQKYYCQNEAFKIIILTEMSSLFSTKGLSSFRIASAF